MIRETAHKTIRWATALVAGFGLTTTILPAPVVAAERAPATVPADGLQLVGQTDTGRVLVTTFDGATSAKNVLAGTARRMAGYFDAKPAFLSAYGDKKDQLVNASFKARRKGFEVHGVVVASVGAKGGSAAIAFDREDAKLSTLPKLLALLPRGPVEWHDASTADGSLKLKLPEGWRITGGQQGMCDVAGADGQFMSLGVHLPIYTPEAEQAWKAQQVQIGIAPTPSGLPVAPYTDPAQAVRNVFPQVYARMAAANQGNFKLGDIVETSEAPVAEGVPGKAALVHYTFDSVGKGPTVRVHGIAYVLCMPAIANGQWTLYYSEVGASEAVFDRDLPMMLKAWGGYTISNEEVRRRMDDAMQKLHEANRIVTESAANTRHAIDRCSADFDEVIRGYRTVEDTETGKWSDVDLGWSHTIVDKLNEHAGYKQFIEIPRRDQIFSP